MTILFVCTGNTCRSPMAEGYLVSRRIQGLKVLSRGLAADGSPVSANAAAVMMEMGIDIHQHRSRILTVQDLSAADKILCLSPSHMASLAAAQEARGKLFVLGKGIPDPFGGDIPVYRRCRDEIVAAVDHLLEQGFFSTVIIKSMEQKHLAPMAKLEKLCFSQPWSQEALFESYRHGTHFFVAEKNDRFVGYAGVTVVADQAYITNVAVSPQVRRQGVATALLDAVFACCREKHASFVSLEVRVNNHAAIALYEKAGFSVAGKRKDFYSAPREDALIMTKWFQEDSV